MIASTRLASIARLGLSFLLVISLGCAKTPRWNVVLVSLDTTRADRLGCYGNEKIETPHLDTLAASGVLFEQAFTPVPITAPSHSSILTGKYPLAHGLRDNGLFTLGEGQRTLAEILKEHGYATAAAVGSYPLLARFGLDQGFDLYDDHLSTAFENVKGEEVIPRSRIYFDERPAGMVNEALYPWLDEHLGGPDADQPFFLWAHYFDPHQPLEPPPPYDQLFADPYDGEIAYADEAFGRLLERIERHGALDRTLVIFVSDHGEGLGEHGELTHSLLAYNSTLHVPLIIRAPDARRGARISQRVSTVDIVPTVLDFLGIEAPDDVQGISLAPAIRDAAPVPDRPLYAETLSPRLSQGWGEQRALFEGDHKLIFGPRVELYDLEADPRELQNLAEAESELTDRLQRHLARFLKEHAAVEAAEAAEVDDETRRRLVALGYVHSGAGDAGPIEEVLRRDGEAPQDRVGDIADFTFAKQFMLEKRYLAAHEIAGRLIQGDPDNPSYLEVKAIAEIKLGRTDEAEKTVAELRALPLGSTMVASIERDLAGHLSRRGERERALALLRAAQRTDATPAGHHLSAQVLASLGRGAEQRAELEAALELKPSYAPARLDLAILQARGGERRAAVENFRRVIADEPYFARGHFNLGAFLVEEQELEPAIPHFRRAVVLDPNYWQAHQALIAIFVTLDRRREAEEQLAILERSAPPETISRARELLQES